MLESGRILEHGARTKLASDPHSHFYRLLRAGGHADLETILDDTLTDSEKELT